MKIIVTGACGFIGSHLCETLLLKGYEVIGVDNLSNGNLANISSCLKNSKFVFYKHDVNKDNLENIFKLMPDYVFHYASKIGVETTLKDPSGVIEDIQGTKNVLNCARKYPVKKILFASSSEVYGEPFHNPCKENQQLNPCIPYADSKLTSESMIKLFGETYGKETCILRFFNVYGPRQNINGGFVIPVFIKQIIANKPITIFSDGKQIRDFMFIEDNIKATILAMENKMPNGECINVGSGNPISILQLVDALSPLSKHKICIRHESPRSYDVRTRYPDISKVKLLLNFNPSYDLAQGLKKTFNWFYKNKYEN